MFIVFAFSFIVFVLLGLSVSLFFVYRSLKGYVDKEKKKERDLKNSIPEIKKNLKELTEVIPTLKKSQKKIEVVTEVVPDIKSSREELKNTFQIVSDLDVEIKEFLEKLNDFDSIFREREDEVLAIIESYMNGYQDLKAVLEDYVRFTDQLMSENALVDPSVGEMKKRTEDVLLFINQEIKIVTGVLDGQK